VKSKAFAQLCVEAASVDRPLSVVFDAVDVVRKLRGA
jgi:hypothetical protein